MDMFSRISMLLEFVFLSSHWHVPHGCYSLPSSGGREVGACFLRKVKNINTFNLLLSELLFNNKTTIAFMVL